VSGVVPPRVRYFSSRSPLPPHGARRQRRQEDIPRLHYRMAEAMPFRHNLSRHPVKLAWLMPEKVAETPARHKGFLHIAVLMSGDLAGEAFRGYNRVT
jgi:hypothetical protein